MIYSLEADDVFDSMVFGVPSTVLVGLVTVVVAVAAMGLFSSSKQFPVDGRVSLPMSWRLGDC